MKFLKSLFMLFQMLVLVLVFSVSAQAETTFFNADKFKGSTMHFSVGQGELGNATKTDRMELYGRMNINPFHIAIRHEVLDGHGVIDSTRSTLIDGKRTAVGLGAHTRHGTYATLFYDDVFLELDLFNRRIVNERWGLGVELGMNHLNQHHGSPTDRDVVLNGKRKTTGVRVGIYKTVYKGLTVQGTVYVRNNTKSTIDDYYLTRLQYSWI